MYELTNAELDAVCGGANQAAVGLVNVQVGDVEVDIERVLSDNDVRINANIAVLSAGGQVINRP